MEHHHHDHKHHHDKDCGCKHGHSHDEDCDCKHGHSHDEDCDCKHGHSHDEDCDCKHGHSHDEDCDCKHGHSHDEDCDCKHGHSHDAPYIVDGHTHEGASVGTGTLTVTGNYQELENILRTELKTLADWVTKQGGIIGHIKSSLVASHTTMLSITEEEVNTVSSDSEEIHINMAAIVFSVPLEDVKTQVETICQTLIRTREK